MENDLIQNHKVINVETSNKIESLIKKITIDLSNSFLESINLDELRKNLKVLNIAF